MPQNMPKLPAPIVFNMLLASLACTTPCLLVTFSVQLIFSILCHVHISNAFNGFLLALVNVRVSAERKHYRHTALELRGIVGSTPVLFPADSRLLLGLNSMHNYSVQFFCPLSPCMADCSLSKCTGKCSRRSHVKHWARPHWGPYSAAADSLACGERLVAPVKNPFRPCQPHSQLSTDFQKSSDATGLQKYCCLQELDLFPQDRARCSQLVKEASDSNGR